MYLDGLFYDAWAATHEVLGGVLAQTSSRGRAAPEAPPSPAQHGAGGRLKSAVAVSEADAAEAGPLSQRSVPPLQALHQESVGDLMKRHSGGSCCLTRLPSVFLRACTPMEELQARE